MDLATLADQRDLESRETYLSVFVDLTDARYERTLDQRLKEVRAAIGDARAETLGLDAAWERAHTALGRLKGKADTKGAAVFVSAVHDFEHARALAAPVATQLILDSSPYVRPLARFEDEYEPFVLALLDGERGALFLVDEARAEKAGGRKLDLMGRHTKGGWSQMRYQRARQGVVDRFLDDLAERVDTIFREGEADRLVVAGPGQAKHRFVNALPPALAEKVVAVEDADFTEDNESELVARFVRLARREEAESSRDTVDALRDALRRGELATTGPFEVARAARDGRVALIVVLKDTVAGGRKCEEHRTFFEVDATCGVCGTRGTEVDLIEEAVEGTLRADGHLEFVDPDREDAFLRDVGGVGALLRW